MTVGGFLGDQATHLAQADHPALPPTFIERQLQRHRWVSVFAGMIIAVMGVLTILR